MDRLPQEIIDRIAALLPADKVQLTEPLAPSRERKQPDILQRLVSKVRRERDHAPENASPRYWTRASVAAISSRWQRAVEPLVYATLVVRGDAALEKLCTGVASRPERRAYLRSLTVVLTVTHRHWTGRGVNKEELLRPLFSVLCDVQMVTVELTLRFEAGHPDLRHRARQGIVFDDNGGKPLEEAVRCVRKLDFTPVAPDTERARRNVLQLHLAEQARLVVAHFPNLQAVGWHSVESEAQAERDAARDSFTECLAEKLPQRRDITKVSVALRLGKVGFGICAPTGVGAASYTRLLQTLPAEHVEEFQHAGVVAPALFEAARWTALRKLTVSMALLDSEGRFYFAGETFSGTELDTPPGWRGGNGRMLEDGERFRELPDEEVMEPLLRALAGLLARLPKLETARLVARRGAVGAPLWEVCYCAPGKTRELVTVSGEMDIDRPRVWFVTGRWRPGDELVREFRKAGRGAGHGEEASVMYWSMEDSPVRL